MTARHPIPRVLSLVGVALTATLLVVAPAAADPVTGVDALDETVDAVDAVDGVDQAGSRSTQPRQAGEALVGTFRITAGECGGDGISGGSYFRMATPAGNPENGPWVNNTSSPCDDNTYTPLSPGTDGGLSTDDYQPHPDPAFDDDNNALASLIIQPTGFNGTDFSVATNPVDPQTETEVPVPEITASGGDLSGQITAWAAAWNDQHFNQGSPKPDGDQPGDTFGPTGTYDPATGAFTLEWASLIVGGPFDNFTGVWRLEGTFQAGSGGTQEGGAGTTTPGDTSSTAPGGTGTTSGDDGAAAEAAGSGPTPRTGGTLPALAALALTGGGLLSRRVLTSAR